MTVQVSFDIKRPSGCSDDAITAWLCYVLGDSGSLSTSNPLIDKPLQPILGTLKIYFSAEKGGGGR